MRPTRAPVRTVAPATTLISLAEVKSMHRIDGTDEDARLAEWIKAATAHVEGLLGRVLVASTWRHDFEDWGDRELILALPDVQSLVVTYTDPAGVTQTLQATEYHLVEGWTRVVVIPRAGKVWPSLQDVPNAVQVTAVHGIAAADPAIDAIRQALLVIVGDWIKHRETTEVGNIATAPVFATVEALLAEHRARWAAA